VPNTFNLVSGNTGDRFVMPDLPAIYGIDIAGTVAEIGPHVVHLDVAIAFTSTHILNAGPVITVDAVGRMCALITACVGTLR